MIFCNKNELYIESDVKPSVCARTILPTMIESEVEDIKKRPFLNKRGVTYTILYKGTEYKLYIPKSYTWDGATIPYGFRWLMGSRGNPEFLIPSCVHDKMCECKWLVRYNRELSSLIFRELLLACGCNRLKANIMYWAVDRWQKLQKGWRDVQIFK